MMLCDFSYRDDDLSLYVVFFFKQKTAYEMGISAWSSDVCSSDLAGIVPVCILSHLACAEEPDNPKNAEQLAAFKAALTALPRAPVSFCNSSGIFLGPDYHFDLGRPGVALYGANPTPQAPNPIRPVVLLQARILQVRPDR